MDGGGTRPHAPRPDSHPAPIPDPAPATDPAPDPTTSTPAPASATSPAPATSTAPGPASASAPPPTQQQQSSHPASPVFQDHPQDPNVYQDPNYSAPFQGFPQTEQEIDIADHQAHNSNDPLVHHTHESASVQEARAALDWMVPVTSGYVPNHVPNGMPPEKYQIPNIHERLGATLDEAEKEQARYAERAKWASRAMNAALFLQIIVNALVTALSAAPSSRSTQIGVSAMGAIGTILASFLVRLRGTQEPERSISHAQNLEKYIRELKAFKLDEGHSVDRKWDRDVHHFRTEFDRLQNAVHQAENGQPMVQGQPQAMRDASAKV